MALQSNIDIQNNPSRFIPVACWVERNKNMTIKSTSPKRKKKRIKKRKVSQVRQEYMRERRRLSYTVSSLRKRGYMVDLSDIAGEIPKRVTRKAVEKLKKIRGYKAALSEIQRRSSEAIKQRSSKSKQASVNAPFEIINETDLTIMVFREKFKDYHVEVSSIVSKWITYVESNFGREELASAIESASEDGIELSSYGGYLIPSDDLALYLQRLSHYVYSSNGNSLQDLIDYTEEIVGDYAESISDAEAAEWGTWARKKRYY